MKPWMQKHRRQLLVGVPLFFLLLIFVVYIFSGRYVSTDDAYVQAAKAAISSNVPGQVIKIYVRDNQVVKKGDALFSLDDKSFKIAVESANAKLTSARLQVQSLKASYQQQLANVQAAQDTLLFQQQEFERQKKLATSGISSQMQLNRATNAFDNAKQQLAAVKQQVANALASLGNNADIMVDDHPIVQQAQAQLDKAKLDLSYTTIIAPIDGIVTKVEQIQRGDYINTGAPVFSLISNKNVWVEANFKETQMTYMHPGQEATFEIDAYPDKDFKGHVISTSPGTGASFSLLPPENATGNWVKIVQRVPVRISIDYNKDMQLLSSGLSVNVTVDTEHSRIFSANDR
jgi:membrane fusion protein (multidrug efflux system)